MPFFGRQGILAKTAEAAGGSGEGYWDYNALGTETNSSTGNGAQLQIDGGSNDAIESHFDRVYTFSCWFALTTAEMGSSGTLGRLMTMENDGQQYGITLYFDTSGVGGNFASNASGNRVYGTTVTNFSANFLDGNWHHIAIQVSDSARTWNLYLDGTLYNYTTRPASGSGSTMLCDRAIAFNGPANGGNTNYNLWNRWGSGGDYAGRISQIYMHNTSIALSTEISKFYSSGWVDMGTDGTASGLAQPKIYIYENGAGALVQGGTLGTLVERNQNSGSITKYSSGGPS